MNTYKKTLNVAIVGVLFILGGCAKSHTVTDNVSLYPANQAAQQWGVLNFYAQHHGQLPNRVTIALPDNQTMTGKITYLNQGMTSESNEYSGNFFDNMHFGIGVGVGHQFGGHSSVGLGFSSPKRRTERNNQQRVQINAYGNAVSMNCEGEFNQRQRAGIVTCQLTNGMQYSGTVRRLVTETVGKENQL